MLGQPRPPGLEPRCRGACRGAPLCLRHARGQDCLGRGTPDLSPQNHHRPPRGLPPQAAAGGHQRLPAHGRERVRRLRRGPRLGLDFGRLRHGQGRRAAGRAAQGGGRHRRRRHDGRSGLRGAQQRRGEQGHRPAGDSQRQQHGHRPGHRRAEELPAQDFDLGPLQPPQAAALGRAVAYAAAAAPLPEDGQRHQAGAAQQEQPLREPQLPLLRPGRRPQPQGAGAHAARPARHRRPEAAPRHDGQGQGLPAGRARPARMARPGASTSIRASASSHRRARRATRMSSARRSSTWRGSTGAWWASRRPCPRAAR